jgi:nifR3 family TIM-barrel protein
VKRGASGTRPFASPQNRDVPLAGPAEFAALSIGPLVVDPPVVLAPMAGVTNFPFRSLCREFGAGLYVSEMISARGYLNGHRLTRLLASSHADEAPRSVQIYATDPKDVFEMARSLVDAGVHHLDMNFGCPVPKVTRHGGGSAIPLKKKLFGKLVAAGVAGAGRVPFTVKMRKGIDESLLTYVDAGRIAADAGAAAIGLHARTAAELYAGEADWNAIGTLKSAVAGVPILGNGDIWEAFDALRMMRMSGCDGVIVGRGCLGRPWLFRELADVFAGREPADPPNLRAIVAIMEDHARRLCAFFGDEVGMRQMRKWCAWYTKGFRGSSVVREALVRVTSIEAMLAALSTLDLDEPFPLAALRAPRGKTGRQHQVALPHGYLECLDDESPPDEHASGDDAESYEDSLSGG